MDEHVAKRGGRSQGERQVEVDPVARVEAAPQALQRTHLERRGCGIDHRDIRRQPT